MQKVMELHLLNKLYHGSIFDILPSIPDESVDCIFADPDYNVGVKYQGKRYTTDFNSYLGECIEWARESRRILKRDGNFFIVNYGKNSAYLRVNYLDNAFYNVYEYVWVYRTNIGHGEHHFTTAHRIILHCTKSPDNKFYKDAVAQPYQNPGDRRIKELIKSGSPGRMPYSWLEGTADGTANSERDWFEFNLVKKCRFCKNIPFMPDPGKTFRNAVQGDLQEGRYSVDSIRRLRI